MSQWHKLQWNEKHCDHEVEGIRLTPHTLPDGTKTLKPSHATHPFHELDWHSDDAKSEGAAHLHDGVVHHISVHPAKRPQGISVHALWKDKDGNVIRRDAHFQGI
jgi:hypothetical protein